MTQRISLTAQAHTIIKKHLKPGDIAIDATVGNGHDILFLAQQVGINGKVFGFDIQQQAINSTQLRLESHNIESNTYLFHSSHDKMQQFIPTDIQGKIKVIMFNLGYLPGSDKSIITQTTSTLSALEQSIHFLDHTGIITVAAYPGHAGGDSETEAIIQWLKHLSPDQYNVQIIYSSEKETAPRLYIIQKTAERLY